MDAITEHHYKNIATGKAKPLDDGDLATVRTIIVEIDGVETLIPTIWDGEEVDDRTAIKFAQDSGVDWPTRTGPDAVAELQAFDEQIHLEMTDQTTPQEAARILSNVDTPEMALGGLAVARKGITTPEGLEMANKTTQLDRKKADKNNDGKLSKYEETVGKAVQNAMADDPEQDEKVLKFQSGGTAITTNTSGLSGLNLSRSLPDTTGFLPAFVQESLSDAERHKMNILGVVPPYILNLLTARELNSMPESLVSESLSAARRGPPTEEGVQEVMDKEGNPIKRPENKFEREPFPYNYTLPLMDRANLLPEEMSDKDKYPDRYPSQTAKPKCPMAVWQ